MSAVTSEAIRSQFELDPDVVFLNHGSFGARLKVALEAQGELRRRLEKNPVQFMARDLERLQDEARERLAPFLGVRVEDFAFAPNATAGVNAVLRSLPIEPGDELLTTTHEYNACRNALEFVAERAGATVTVAEIPFPIRSEDEALDAILECVSERTRIALIDHVTSQTALVLPIKRIVQELDARGVDTLVDGAHGPGMLPLEIDDIGAAYYTANLHKWVGAPLGAAFLHVRADRQDEIRPIAISHGANSPRTDRSRFQIEFGWTGTHDPTAALVAPVAVKAMGSLFPDGGWAAVRDVMHSRARAARKHLCAQLEIEAPAPESMIGSMFSLPLPDGAPDPPKSALYADPLQIALYERHRVEVPIIPWPAPPKRLLRPSCHVYNGAEEYERLGEAVLAELAAEAAAG